VRSRTAVDPDCSRCDDASKGFFSFLAHVACFIYTCRNQNERTFFYLIKITLKIVPIRGLILLDISLYL